MDAPITPPPTITTLDDLMKVYAAQEVHAALTWAPLAHALERAFIAGAQVPLRHAHALSARDTLLLMPAWNDQVLVLKLVTVMPGAAATVQATLLVCNRADGEPLAVLDGEAVTLRRTAATSALAARHLARADAHTLLIVGTGRLAPWMARAHATLRPGLRRVQVWGRRPEEAQARARELDFYSWLAARDAGLRPTALTVTEAAPAALPDADA